MQQSSYRKLAMIRKQIKWWGCYRLQIRTDAQFHSGNINFHIFNRDHNVIEFILNWLDWFFLLKYSFLAKNADTITRYINKPKSKFTYVVIAQALDEKVPPFILQMYGTGVGSFTSQDVINRWDFTIEELDKWEIIHFICIFQLN